MNSDTSVFLFDKLLNLEDDEVEVTLEDNIHLRGVIIGFFFGMPQRNEPFVLKWHLVKKQDRYTFGKGVLGCSIGAIFHHAEVRSILFLQDYSMMEFK